MAEIINYANLIGEGDYQEIKTKFPAFLSAPLSKKAKKQDAYESDTYNTGWYFTRKAWAGSSGQVESVCTDGDLGWSLSNRSDAGLRVALQTIYNPDSSLVKGCQEISRTAQIWDEKKQKVIETTSKAPVVTFGKKQYIWLNKAECEKGDEITMRLVSLELLARSVPFDKEGKTNDYGNKAADEIRKQCEDEALEFATKEEKAMLVKVKLSSKDGYERAEPILELDKTKLEEVVKAQQEQIEKQNEKIKSLEARLAKYEKTEGKGGKE